MISPYQKEHPETLRAVRRYLEPLDRKLPEAVKEELERYHTFRRSVDNSLHFNFKQICTTHCFINDKTVCCSREGIIAFFADVVINAPDSSTLQPDLLEAVLKRPDAGTKCVYLKKNGCLWRVRPVVCALFLCATAEKAVLAPNQDLARKWVGFRRRQRQFSWPGQVVLFDTLEKAFQRLGVDVLLIYFHNSPGPINIKRKAGLR